MTTERVAAADTRSQAVADENGDAGASPRASLAHRLQYGAYRIAGVPVRALRHERSIAIGSFIGRLCWIVLTRRRRVATRNIARIFPDRPADEQRRIARRSVENFGRFMVEVFSAMRFSADELDRRFDVVGGEHLEAAAAAGRGVIILTGHLGPFDLAAFPLYPRVGTLNMVFRPPSNPYMDREVRAMRARAGTVPVPRKRASQRLFLILRRGGVMAAAIDQRINPLGGILVDFLGRPAWTASVPALLQQKTGATVVPLFAYPGEPGRYRLEVEAPVSLDGLGDDPEAELTRRYLEPLERRIRRDPDLWLWLHDRWQIVFRHNDPRFRERIARESGLDGLPPVDGTKQRSATALDRESRRVLEWEFLESCRNVALTTSPDQNRVAARALVASALAEGWAARAEHAPALATRLLAAEEQGRLGAELRELDRRPLVWIEGLDEVTDPVARRLLAKQLQRRAGRGSMILEAGSTTRREDALDAEVARALAFSFHLPL